jgi:hypothetical protein
MIGCTHGASGIQGDYMVRRNLFAFIFVGLILSAACCWSAEPSGKGPKAYLADNVFEFKPVVEGTEIIHEFVLQNRGMRP